MNVNVFPKGSVSPPLGRHMFLEEDGADSNAMELRSALQHFERKGLVDFVLGGHSCIRPPSVQQGKEADRFEISSDPLNALVWKPNNIQSKNLKAANVASAFSWTALKASPLEIVPRHFFSVGFELCFLFVHGVSLLWCPATVSLRCGG